MIIIHSGTHKVLSVLPAHEAPVTTVALHALPFVEGRSQVDALILVTSANGKVTAWYGAAQPSNLWTRCATWQAHESESCVAVALCELAGMTAAVTAGMEGDIKLWCSDSMCRSWICKSETSLAAPGSVLLECLAMRQVTEDAAVVAVAGTDGRIWLFHAAISSEPHLLYVATLSGHRDWVRGLAFSAGITFESSSGNEEEGFFFASASKDGTARVWSAQPDVAGGDPDEFDLHTARVQVILGGKRWSFSAVALLDEHTSAVHSVEFANTPQSKFPQRLVTSSMDCSVAVWRLTHDARWECEARFGLMGGGSAHALGFFGASFSSRDGNEILGHNFAGALHCWKARHPNLEDAGGQTRSEFLAYSAPGGHFAAVTDLAWDRDGRYLLTCSADKTTRIYAEVDEDKNPRFVEWARPQVHGHAIFAAAFCDEDGRRFVSGAEERMLRIFEAPRSFRLPGEETDAANADWSRTATAAVLPELGLSNKATFDVADGGATAPNASNSQETNASSAMSNADLIVSTFGADRAISMIPLEEDLKQRRLWPETAKLYGHGNEISCVATDLTHSILASACRAQAAKDAAIILWDSTTGAECGRLSCHDLTINQMCFSQDGKALLSVSRDRSFAIFQKLMDGSRFNFSLAFRRTSAHTRLIYAGTWLFGDRFVGTGGRDKYLKVFPTQRSNAYEAAEVFKRKFDFPVTALDVLDSANEQEAVLATGFENGSIRIFRMSLADDNTMSETLLFATTSESNCGARINRLRWRPVTSISDGNTAVRQLAVASEDTSARILAIELPSRTGP